VICSGCQHENDPGAKFCEECGTPFPKACPSCAEPVKATAKFCSNCGTRLGAKPAPPPPSKPPESKEAERRQLTVMFCDLVGFTELTEQLDPEDLTTIIKRYQATAVAAIQRYEGFVARYFGDGILAYFCYPKAHEDDAERAVRAGLDIIADVGAIEIGHDLRVRIGIATGRVVVGDVIGEGASKEASVLGVTPNLAARLQGLAEPGQVVVAARTWKLVRRSFEGVDLGKHKVKGISEPVGVWRIAGTLARRFADDEGALELVGRELESSLLCRRWAQARDGEGQLVQVVAEAGIGKSSLVRRFRRQIGADAEFLLAASPYHRNSAFYPIIQMLGAPLDDLVDTPEGLGATEIRERRIAAILDLFRERAGTDPLLVILEDAHWVDASTLEVLDRLVARSRSLPQLVVVTYRPEFSRTWPSGADVSTVSLTRLGRADTRGLVQAIAGEYRLPDDAVEEIVRKTDGVPLYVEELTKAVIEGDVTGIPDSLQDSLMARLDRLPSTKEIAQFAATIGRNFSLELLSVASGRGIEALRTAMTELVDAELVHETGGSQYAFKHALVRDTAYASLLHKTLRATHARIAAHLESTDAAPEQIGHHYAAALDAPKAALAYKRAAEIASDASANVEATAMYESALECLDKARDMEGKEVLRLEILIGYSGRLRVMDRYADAFPVLHDAIALGKRVGQDVDVAQLYYLLGGIHFSSGNLDDSLEAHTHSKNYAHAAKSARQEVQALSGISDIHYGQGRMRSGKDILEQLVGICLENPGLDDVRAMNLPALGVTKAYLGRFAEGVADGETALSLAQQRGVTRAEMVARQATLVFNNFELGNYAAAEENARAAMELTERIGARQWYAGSLLNHGMVVGCQRRSAAAAAQLQEALRLAEEAGIVFFGGWIVGALARATLDPAERTEALDRGEALLANGGLSHNHLWFGRLGMEACLLADDWERAERLATELEEYTSAQPLLWSDHMIRMTRALAARGRGNPDPVEDATLKKDLTSLKWRAALDFWEQWEARGT